MTRRHEHKHWHSQASYKKSYKHATPTPCRAYDNERDRKQKPPEPMDSRREPDRERQKSKETERAASRPPPQGAPKREERDQSGGTIDLCLDSHSPHATRNSPSQTSTYARHIPCKGRKRRDVERQEHTDASAQKGSRSGARQSRDDIASKSLTSGREKHREKSQHEPVERGSGRMTDIKSRGSADELARVPQGDIGTEGQCINEKSQAEDERLANCPALYEVR